MSDRLNSQLFIYIKHFVIHNILRPIFGRDNKQNREKKVELWTLSTVYKPDWY